MEELYRIDNFNSGEKPTSAETTTITVTNIQNPKEVLDTCKQIVKTLLQYPDLEPESPKWNALFPQKIVKIIEQLDDDDYGNDDELYSIQAIVEDFQNKNLREWEWYSSKLEPDGFQLNFEGWFSFRNYWMVHIQLIPYSKILIEDRFGSYHNKVIKDVMTYKQFQV